MSVGGDRSGRAVWETIGRSPSRRNFLGAGASCGLSFALGGCMAADGRGAGVPPSPSDHDSAEPEAGPTYEPPATEGSELDLKRAESLEQVENTLGGRLGVFAYLADGSSSAAPLLSHRSSERFAMCSTFKWALAAAVLKRVEVAELRLDRPLPFDESDLDEYAPVARKHVTSGSMTLEEACSAAVTVSDNTAANLLIELIGGPSAVTAMFGKLGDGVSRLDRIEPSLNSNDPGDPRDTTTPQAMAQALGRALTSNVLSPESRALLTRWLVESRTGDRRLRAGLSSTMTVGGKTGTGANGACNDVIVVWPQGQPPLVVAAYLSGSRAPIEQLEGALCRVGELVQQHLSARGTAE